MPLTQPSNAYRQFSSVAPTDVKFSADGTRLAITEGTRLRVYDVATGNLIADLDYGATLRSVDYSPDGRYVVAVVATAAGAAVQIKRFDWQTGTTTTFAIPAGGNVSGSPHDIAFLSNGNVLLSQNGIGTLIEYDFSSGATTFHTGPSAQATLVANADHSKIFVVSPNLTVRTDVFTSGAGITATNIARPDPYAGASVPPPQIPAGAVSADGLTFAAGERLILRNGSLATTVDLDFYFMGDAAGLAFSPAGDRLFLLFNLSIVEVDVATGQAVRIYAVSGSPLSPYGAFGDLLQVSGDGRYLSVMTTNGVVVIDRTLAIPVATNGDDTISEPGTVIGLAGNDTLDGPGGWWMFGGPGDDTYIVDGSADWPEERPNEGTDQVLLSYQGTFFLSNYVENLTVVTANGATAYGNVLANQLIGGAGPDKLFGSAGNDTVTGNAGADILGGDHGDDQLTGGDGDDAISGGLGADGLAGGAGDDLLASDEFQPGTQTPRDDLLGDADTIQGNEGNDTIWIGFGDSADGGGGTDTLSLSLAVAPSGQTINTASLVGLGPFSLGGGTIAGFEQVQRIAGSELADTITIAGLSGPIQVDGRGGDDVVTGGSSPVSFDGGSGNDRLYSGAGAEAFNGGSGIDTIDYSLSGSPVTVILGPGFGGTGPGGDTLTFVENAVGSNFDDTITGSSSSNLLIGGGGNDTLSDGGGQDTLEGGAGNDSLVVSPFAASVSVFDGGEGSDTIDYRNYFFNAFVDLESGSGSNTLISIENVISGAGSDSIWGSTGANRIETGGGHDFLAGRGGGDTLIGGSGNDFYDGVMAGDTVTEAVDGGTDTVIANLASYVLADNVENLTSGFEGAVVFTGNGLDNTILGGAGNDQLHGAGGNDILDGLDGHDQLFGGIGDDIYLINEGADDTGEVTELADEGIDLVRTSLASFTLPANVENLWALYFTDAALTFTGNGLANSIRGSDGNDLLTGGDGNDTLEGEFGNDTLNGEAGNDALLGGFDDDTLDGGAGINNLAGEDGNDRLLIEASGAGSSFDGGAGIDTLAISGSVSSFGTITAMEGIDLVGGASLTLTGAQLASGFALNTALSGSGTVTITMDAGVLLSITGFQGAAANPGIAFTINGTAGTDAIKAAHFSNTILGGAGHDQIRGGNGVDTIDGGTERDKIAGWGGADILTGGGGNDQFRYLFATDSGIGAAADRITDFTIGSDVIDFRLLDSDPGTPGIQNYAFSFIGAAAFSNGGGAQVRYADSGANLLVQMDLDGNGVADMEVILQGLAGQSLSGTDFVL